MERERQREKVSIKSIKGIKREHQRQRESIKRAREKERKREQQERGIIEKDIIERKRESAGQERPTVFETDSHGAQRENPPPWFWDLFSRFVWPCCRCLSARLSCLARRSFDTFLFSYKPETETNNNERASTEQQVSKERPREQESQKAREQERTREPESQRARE